MTAIHKPSFELISIAYANYILSYHKFINDIELIIKELAIEALEMKKFIKFKKIFKTFEELQANAIFHIFVSAEEIFVDNLKGNKLSISSVKRLSSKKQKEIKKRVNSEFKSRALSHKEFLSEIYIIIGKPKLSNFFKRKFLKKSSKRMKKRLEKLTVEFE